MAEKYGTIPKRFTKEWFDYVWTYYKWHIMAPIIVFAFVGYTAYECTHRTPYDTDVIYAGYKIFTEGQTDEISKNLAFYANDINEDGQTLVSFRQINFSGDAGMEETDYNMQMKLDLQLQTDAAYAYIFDEKETKLMLEREEEDLIYLPVTEWASIMPSDDMLYSKNGVAYAVSLKDNEKVKALGINSDDLYMIIKQNHSKDEEEILKFENAKKIADALISQ